MVTMATLENLGKHPWRLHVFFGIVFHVGIHRSKPPGQCNGHWGWLPCWIPHDQTRMIPWIWGLVLSVTWDSHWDTDLPDGNRKPYWCSYAVSSKQRRTLGNDLAFFLWESKRKTSQNQLNLWSTPSRWTKIGSIQLGSSVGWDFPWFWTPQTTGYLEDHPTNSNWFS